MNWFKFDWFGSKERKQLQSERDLNEILIQHSEALTKEIVKSREVASKPYKNLYYTSDIVTVVLQDGTLLSKQVDKSVFEQIREANTEKEILDLLSPTVVETQTDTQEQLNMVLNNLGILKFHPEFEIKGNSVFLKGINLAIPPSVLASFIEICEKIESVDVIGREAEFDEYSDQYEALKMFWIKLALNGLEQSRQDLLMFVKENDVRITRNGNLVLYRRIVTTGTGNKALVKYISQEYYNVKRLKKNPEDYAVVVNDAGGDNWDLISHEDLLNLTDTGMKGKIFGNLKELYLDLPNMEANTYTSAHNKGRYTIQIGSIYREDESKINLDNGLCAAGGLHAAAVDYNYSGFGDTPVVVLVNPSKAITVPLSERAKLRTTEMFIAAINDKPIGTHFDDGALSAFDEEYNNLTISELEEAIKQKSFNVASVQEHISPISFTDLETIKDMLKGRIKQI